MADEKKVCSALWDLVQTVAFLRGPTGCPWDRAQRPEDLRASVIEEAYEVVHALTEGSPEAVVEELGDLLLQVVFLARIFEERGVFTIADVAERLVEKLRRRHPHVFGDVRAETPEEVLRNWEALKARERGHERLSERLRPVASHLPALAEAWAIQRKAAQVGFDWKDWRDIAAKVREELAELEERAETGPDVRVEEEVGDLLFAVVNLSRRLRVNPEVALKEANRKFIRRFAYIEERLAERGLRPEQVSLEEMDRLWEEAKRQEAENAGPVPRRKGV
jgi:tetrapyrrole methylase family protein/MazG family protein